MFTLFSHAKITILLLGSQETDIFLNKKKLFHEKLYTKQSNFHSVVESIANQRENFFPFHPYTIASFT